VTDYAVDDADSSHCAHVNSVLGLRTGHSEEAGWSGIVKLELCWSVNVALALTYVTSNSVLRPYTMTTTFPLHAFLFPNNPSSHSVGGDTIAGWNSWLARKPNRWCAKQMLAGFFTSVAVDVKNNVLPVSTGKNRDVGGIYFYVVTFLYRYMSCNITQRLIKEQNDTLNSSHGNLSKVTATLRNRCKQYFLNYNFERKLKTALIFLGTQVFF